MRYGSLDRYSFRPYFYPNGRVLFKLTVNINGDFHLVPDDSGKHYEQFVDLSDPLSVVRAMRLAVQGRLGGHKPYASTPMRKHSGKLYPKRVMVKGRGEKVLVLAGRGNFDRVSDFEPITGLTVGLSYLVPAKDVTDLP